MDSKDEFDLERMLARSQLGLSIMFVAGYFGLIWLTSQKYVDGSYVKDLTPIVGIIVYYWFQRQRPHSGTDGNGTNHAAQSETAARPTPAPVADQPPK